MRSRIPFLIVLTSIAVLIILVVLGLLSRYRQISADLPIILQNELRAYLHREVKIHDVRIVSSGHARVAGISIADGPSFKSGTLLTAESADITFNTTNALLGRTSAVGSVVRIILQDPRLYLTRDRNGRLNVADLLHRPPAPPNRRFRGIVQIGNGYVRLTDYASKARTQPARNAVRDANGTIDFGTIGLTGINLAGAGVTSTAGSVQANGYWGTKPLTITVKDADVAYWLHYIALIRSWDLPTGRFDGKATILGHTDHGVDYNGVISIRNGSFMSPRLRFPLRSLSGRVVFVKTDLDLNAKALLGTSPILLTGKVHRLSHSNLQLRIRGSQVDVKELIRAIRALPPIPMLQRASPVAIDSTITGTASDLLVNASFSVPSATVYGTRFANLTGRGYYSRRVIHMTSLTGQSAGGTFRLLGDMSTSPLSATIRGSASGLRLADLPFAAQGLHGTASADFQAAYRNSQLSGRVSFKAAEGGARGLSFASSKGTVTFADRRHASITASLGDVRYSGLRATSVSADFSISPTGVDIRNSTIVSPSGGFEAAGTASWSGPVDIKVSGKKIDLGAFARLASFDGISGTADVTGTVTGSLTDPVLDGRFVAQNGGIRGFLYDSLSASLSVSQEHLSVRDMAVARGASSLRTVGTASISQGKPLQFHLKAHAEHINLHQAASIVTKDAPITGDLSADLSIQGSYPALTVEGHTEITHASFAGTPIDLAKVDMSFAREKTEFAQFLLQRDNASLAGSGYIERDRLNLHVTSRNLDLSRANRYAHPYVELHGPVTVSGDLTGPIVSPSFSGTVESTGLTVNREPFARLISKVSWNGNTVQIADSALSSADAEYALDNISFEPATSSIQLTARVIKSSVSNVMGVLKGSPILGIEKGSQVLRLISTAPTPFTGSLSGSLQLSGKLTGLHGVASIQGTTLVLGTSHLQRAEVQIALWNSHLYAKEIAITGPGIAASFSEGTPDSDSTQVKASVTNTDLEVLRELIVNLPLLPDYEMGQTVIRADNALPYPIGGVLNGSLSLSSLHNPSTGSYHLSATNIRAAGTPIGNLSADGRVSQGTWYIDALRGTPASGSLEGNGWIDSHGTLYLNANGSGIGLALLHPWLHERDVSGSLSFGVTARGQISNPVVDMSLSVQTPHIQGVTFDSVSVSSMHIEGGRAALDSLSITKAKGVLKIAGYIPFVWHYPFVPENGAINIGAVVDDPDLSLAKAFPAIITSAGGKLSAGILATGTVADPLLSGQVQLSDSEIGIKGFRNKFTKLNIRGTLEGSTLSLDTLSGSSSLGGSFSGGGNAVVSDIFHPGDSKVTMFITLDGLKIETEDVPHGSGERLSFASTGELVATGNLASPSVQGRMIVRDALLRLPAQIIPTTGNETPYIPINPQFSINIGLAKNVVVERGSLRAQIEGPMTLTGTATRPIAAGTVRIVSGRVSYIARSLQLVSGGTITFLLAPPSPSIVNINLQARTAFSALSPVSGRPTRYTVTIDAAGPIANPSVSVRSNPPGLSALQSLGLAFGGQVFEGLASGTATQGQLTQQVGQVLLGAAIPGLFQPVQIGPLSFTVEPGFGGPTGFSTGIALTDKLSLTYSRTFAGQSPIDDLGFSYQFRSNLAFTTLFESQNGGTRNTEYLIEYFSLF